MHLDSHRDGVTENGLSVPTPKAVVTEFRNFLSDVEELVSATASLSGLDLTHARARLSDRLTQAKRFADEMSTALKQNASQIALDTDRYVHEQPWKAVGIVAVAGLLTGVVLARSTRTSVRE